MMRWGEGHSIAKANHLWRGYTSVSQKAIFCVKPIILYDEFESVPHHPSYTPSVVIDQHKEEGLPSEQVHKTPTVAVNSPQKDKHPASELPVRDQDSVVQLNSSPLVPTLSTPPRT